MKSTAVFFSLALLLFSACGSPARLVIDDVIQIRQVLVDDRLAATFEKTDGTPVRCGDAVLTDGTISYTYFKKGADTTTFDLWVVLNERGSSTWKTFTRKAGRAAALLLNGAVLTTFPALPSADKQAMKVVVPRVATSQAEADALQLRLDKKAGKK